MEFLLRTIFEFEDGDTVENFYFLEDEDSMVDKLISIGPDNYKCYVVSDITEEMTSMAVLKIEEKDKDRRKQIYDSLKDEFENN